MEVAIKRFKVPKEENGIDISTVREIKALQELSHRNVVRVVDIFMHKKRINMVLEKLRTDLESVLNNHKVIITGSNIKHWMGMLVDGVAYIHSHWIIHRV